MEKINIAELLRDCPQGMELDCTINDNVKFIKICSSSKYPIILRTKNGYEITLTKYGQVHDMDDSKCVIFPKGETTWEGFQRPFKNGDIVFYDNTIAIFKEWGDETLFRTYVTIYLCCDSLIDTNVPLFGKSVRKEIRFATEKEKQKLFGAIKASGYEWNAETKTLEKLIEPIFKVGDKIKYKNTVLTIITVQTNSYIVEDEPDNFGILMFSQQDKWELINETKFKVGDKIKDTRNNSEGIILKVTDKGFECRFEFGNFLVTFSEQDYFNLVQNKSDITLNMEEINLDWCKQHGMTLSQVNVARDTSYYLETNGYIILVYTTSTTGDQKLHVINPDTKKEIEFSLSRLNRDLNKLNSITTDDLRKLCELVNLDYPFKS